MLQNITQAYTQSKTELNRTIICQLPVELKKKYSKVTILLVLKPLYGLAEAGNHWFATYLDHHKEKLGMEITLYDACLLITKDGGKNFGIAGLQTDNTLNVGTETFMKKEETKIIKANFKAKTQTILQTGTARDFNGCRMTIQNESIMVVQKNQAKKSVLIDIKNNAKKQQYMEQRTRGAYIALICQPEATFDYSIAAQSKKPCNENIVFLNKREQWQLEYKLRGLYFQAIDLSTTKLFVFIDGFFTNNKDQNFHIGYVIVLANKHFHANINKFTIKGNTIHQFLTKFRRITRSILASEIYGTVNGFHLGFVIKQTLATICKRIHLPKITLILCTDSYSLYQCLVWLGTTSEKRLMIDIMALKQLYERREIEKMRWVYGKDNPADAITKASPNSVFQKIILTNKATIRLEGWIKREGQKRRIACVGLTFTRPLFVMYILFVMYNPLFTFVLIGLSVLKNV